MLVPGGTLAVTTPAHGRRTALAAAPPAASSARSTRCRPICASSPPSRWPVCWTRWGSMWSSCVPRPGPCWPARPGRKRAMRIVVTGAAGFLGSHLSERLLAAGHEVHGLDSFTRFYCREQKEANLAGARGAPGFRLFEATASTREGLAGAMAGAQAVCHLAGRPGVRGGAPHAFEEANVRTTEAVLRAAAPPACGGWCWPRPRRCTGRPTRRCRRTRRCGRSRTTAARSCAPSGWRRGWRASSASSSWCCATSRSTARASVPTWPSRASPPPRWTAAEMPLFDDGAQTRDFTYVADACEATRLALQHGRPGATYNVSGGRPATLAEALGLLAGALGREAELTPAAPDCREPRATAADLSRARAELGSRPPSIWPRASSCRPPTPASPRWPREGAPVRVLIDSSYADRGRRVPRSTWSSWRRPCARTGWRWSRRASAGGWRAGAGNPLRSARQRRPGCAVAARGAAAGRPDRARRRGAPPAARLQQPDRSAAGGDRSRRGLRGHAPSLQRGVAAAGAARLPPRRPRRGGAGVRVAGHRRRGARRCSAPSRDRLVVAPHGPGQVRHAAPVPDADRPRRPAAVRGRHRAAQEPGRAAGGLRPYRAAPTTPPPLVLAGAAAAAAGEPGVTGAPDPSPAELVRVAGRRTRAGAPVAARGLRPAAGGGDGAGSAGGGGGQRRGARGVRRRRAAGGARAGWPRASPAWPATRACAATWPSAGARARQALQLAGVCAGLTCAPIRWRFGS